MGCAGSKASNPVAQTMGDFEVALERSSDDQPLGITFLDLDSCAGVLCVLTIARKGLLPEHLKANLNAPDKRVNVGDRVVAVNAVSRSLDKMKAELKAKTVVLTVRRAPTVGPAPVPTRTAEEAAVAPAGARQLVWLEPTLEKTTESAPADAAAETPVLEEAGPQTASEPETVALVSEHAPVAAAAPALTPETVGYATPKKGPDAPAPPGEEAAARAHAPAPGQPAFQDDDIMEHQEMAASDAKDTEVCKKMRCDFWCS